ncbi:response regulator [Gorillibacterium sp. CAU 1737]|uniref:response regulator transcription factor n=1 Tax=Gorillibacterium sp. CAU 1737 TaxID=3140362 RepID=UPI0032611B57
MIRAAVVDDERLVRKGFMSLIDWAAFGVMMVGEAGDGKEALKLIETEAIDLLFVDISMPGMSGFELIRHIRQLHPHIHSVVLTCHHEFDYVQEALRIGAVDYIVKTLLEVENADETIGRIVDRLKWEENMRSGGSREGAGRLSAEKAIVYFPLDRNQGAEKLISLPIVKNHPLIDLGELWLSPLRQRIGMEEARKEIRDRLGDAWLTVLLTEVRPVPFSELAALCSENLQQALFYHPEGHLPLATLSFKDLRAAAEAPAAKGDSGVLDQALDLAWSLVPAEWDRFFEQLSRQRPPYSSVLAFGQRLLQDWGPFLPDGEELAALRKALLACHNMQAWRGWLRGFADLTARRMLELGFTREVMQCMFRSVRYMQANAGQKINQNEVAASIGMSRGYFSQCYARFAGIPFGESLRNMRLNQAKRLLLDTELPIWEVSSRSGFEDERYFSRLFREHVGSLPSEFRTRGGRER